jgi:large subunit ribosomal protein L25
MKNSTLKLEKRKEVGGGRAERLRSRGLIPAVVYGKGMESTAAAVKKADLSAFLKANGRNSVFNTEFAQEQDVSMLIKDIQYDAVRKEVVHLDFQKVNSNERVQVEVPVRVVGRETVEKAGNVVAHQLNTVTVECLPGDIPAHADADISGLKPGRSFTAGDFIFPPGVTLLSKPGDIVLTVNGREPEPEPETKPSARPDAKPDMKPAQET